MLPENKKTLVKMLRLEDTDDKPAHKQIPEKLVSLVNAMELGLENVSRQRGCRWETLAALAAPFILQDMDTEKDNDGEVGIKRGTELTVKRGRQRLSGSFIEKSGDMYKIQLAKEDEPQLVDPAKVILKG